MGLECPHHAQHRLQVSSKHQQAQDWENLGASQNHLTAPKNSRSQETWILDERPVQKVLENLQPSDLNHPLQPLAHLRPVGRLPVVGDCANGS